VAATAEMIYRYPFASSFEDEAGKPRLRLAASREGRGATFLRRSLDRAARVRRLDVGAFQCRTRQFFPPAHTCDARPGHHGQPFKASITLGIAGRESPQIARVIVDTLLAFLAHQQGLPKGAHDVLDVLYQQSHRLGIAAPEPFKRTLLDQKGGTKTGRLAKDLLDLKESASRASAAGLEAVNRLLERAEAEAL
jgi:hypothetical protein